jgi:hypothetical protein
MVLLRAFQGLRGSLRWIGGLKLFADGGSDHYFGILFSNTLSSALLRKEDRFVAGLFAANALYLTFTALA